MNKKLKEVYDLYHCLMMPEVNDCGSVFCVIPKNGKGAAYFEREEDAKFMADTMKDKGSPCVIEEYEVNGFSTSLNGNLENDFTRFWDMWVNMSHYAESIVKGGKLLEGNRMMVAVYAGCLWFFRKAMLKVYKNQQEILKAIKELKEANHE